MPVSMSVSRQAIAPAVSLRKPAPICARRAVLTRFKKDDEVTETEKIATRMNDPKINAALKDMRGADPAVAKQVLKAWKSRGVTDAKSVRRALYKSGFTTIGIIALQAGLESLGAFSAFNTAGVLSFQDFPGHFIASFVVYSIGMYFAIGVAFDLFTAIAVLGSTIVVGNKSDVVFATVESLASDESGGRMGLSVIDKAQQAVNTGRVVGALNSIANALKIGEESGAPSLDTLDRLGALMILKDAEENWNFKPSSIGLGEQESLRLASKFAQFDLNSDCKLEFSEFKKFCDASDFKLSDEEVKAGMKMLDENGDGFIEFNELASWWVQSKNKTGDLKKAAASA